MPFINADPYITVGRLKEIFHKETGLHLQVKFKNLYESDDTLLGYLELNSFPEDMSPKPNSINDYIIHVGDFDEIRTLKSLIETRIHYEIEISDTEGNLRDDSKLKDFISDDIKNMDLTPKEIYVKANSLNEQLIIIEKDIYSRWSEIKNSFDQKLNEDNNWLDDYEIELIINYYISQSDHNYVEKGNNILLNVTRQLQKEAWASLINDGYYHRCVYQPQGLESPICFLYHELYEHYHLSHYDMQRIGRIWVDIKVCHQHCYDMKFNFKRR